MVFWCDTDYRIYDPLCISVTLLHQLPAMSSILMKKYHADKILFIMFRCLNFHHKNVVRYVTFSWSSYANTQWICEGSRDQFYSECHTQRRGIIVSVIPKEDSLRTNPSLAVTTMKILRHIFIWHSSNNSLPNTSNTSIMYQWSDMSCLHEKSTSIITW